MTFGCALDVSEEIGYTHRCVNFRRALQYNGKELEEQAVVSKMEITERQVIISDGERQLGYFLVQ